MLSILNYDFFPPVALFYIIFLIRKLNLRTFNPIVLKIYVFTFYFLRIISGVFQSFNNFWSSMSQTNYVLNGKFIDMQGIFWALNCNSGVKDSFQLFGTNQILECPYSVSYGPLTEIIYFQNSVYFPTLVTLVFSIIFLLKIFNDTTKNFNQEEMYMAALIFISPPINFLIERLNFDIIIFIILYFALKNEKDNLLSVVLIFTISLIKYYPIFLLISNLIFNFITKNFKKFSVNALFVTLFSIIYYYENFLNIKEYKPVTPFRPDRTFGLLSESYNFENAFRYKWIYFYAFLLFIILLFIKSQKLVSNTEFLIKSKFDFDLIFLFVCLGFLANYDYRAALLVLLASNFVKIKKKLVFYSFFIFIFSSPGLLHSYGNLFQLVENYNFFYIDFSFLFLISYFLVDLYNYLKNLYLNINKT